MVAEEQLVLNQCGEGDIHVVTFIDNWDDEESIKMLKNFRRFSNKNSDKAFHMKYWQVQDKVIAQKLGLKTVKESKDYC